MHTIYSYLCKSSITRITAVMLVALIWNNAAFCGEIHDAAKSGNLEKVKELLKGDPNLVVTIDDAGDTPLYVAVANGRKDVAEFLLSHKANVNAKSTDGLAPLHWAAAIGNKDMVELLLAHHADVDIKNNNGETPLHLAVVFNYKDVVELLLAHGADINAKDKVGATPESRAIGNDIAKLLRQKGAK